MRILRDEFEVVTILGARYRVTWNEVISWFANIWFYVFLAISQLLLIFAMPHNKAYGLNYLERVIFWPSCTILYVGIYIGFIYIASRRLSGKVGGYYYTPLGMFFATITTTLLGELLISVMHNAPPDFSIFKWFEILFNLIWASVFEAFHFAYNVPRLRRKKENAQDQWENFNN